jgi:DNA-binding NarL/FixJ family response regulator
MPIKILLVDDHRMMREGLRAMLSKEDDMEVVGEAASGETAIRMAGEVGPDVVVLDISMDGIDGIETAQLLFNDYPKIKVVVLSMHLHRSLIEASLKAGVSGYVLKEHAFGNLVDAIKSAMAGEIYLCPEVSRVAIDSYVHNHLKSAETGDKSLTSRERDILKLLAKGKASKEAAIILDISVKTVDAYRRRIMHKLDIQSVAELVKYAIKEGLTSIDD